MEPFGVCPCAVCEDVYVSVTIMEAGDVREPPWDLEIGFSSRLCLIEGLVFDTIVLNYYSIS